jgi:hypothetical protein
MSGTYSKHGGIQKYTENFSWKTSKEEISYKTLGTDERKTLKWILVIQDVKWQTGMNWLKMKSM